MSARNKACSRLGALFANAVGGNPFGRGRLDVNDVEDFVDRVIEASADSTIATIKGEGLPEVEGLRREVESLRKQVELSRIDVHRVNDHISDIWGEINTIKAKLDATVDVFDGDPEPSPPDGWGELPAPSPPAVEWAVILNYMDVRQNPTGNVARIGRYPTEKDAEHVADLLNNLTGSAYLFEYVQV